MKCFGYFDDRDKVCWLCEEVNSMTYHECIAKQKRQLDRLNKERWLKKNCPHSEGQIGKGDEGYPRYYTCKKKIKFNDDDCEPTDECIKKYYKGETK